MPLLSFLVVLALWCFSVWESRQKSIGSIEKIVALSPLWIATIVGYNLKGQNNTTT
jgi:4-amino-4-deoxy-L-arabinose transferase-like glycosyltransferase